MFCAAWLIIVPFGKPRSLSKRKILVAERVNLKISHYEKKKGGNLQVMQPEVYVQTWENVYNDFLKQFSGQHEKLIIFG